MKEKSLKWTTRILLAVAGVFTMLYFNLPKIHAWEIEIQEVQTAWSENADSEAQMNHLVIKETKTGEEPVKGLRLRIPEGILAEKYCLLGLIMIRKEKSMSVRLKKSAGIINYQKLLFRKNINSL